MSKTVSKLALTASVLLAMAFTLSCSGDDGTDEPSSSSAENPSSSVTEPSSSSIPGSSVTTPSSSSVTVSSSSSPPSSSLGVIHGTPVTYEGETYPTVVIGTQTWFAKNLNYAVGGSKCYDNDPTNCEKYGRLYNWATAMTACPSGWHIPSNDDWNVLINYVGGSSTAGKNLKSKSDWNNNGNGTDDYGFSALPGGYGVSDDYIYNVGNGGGWWSSSEDKRYSYFDYVYSLEMGYSGDGVGLDGKYLKSYLLSVRCVQD